jgi:hypothetical protein
MEVKPPLNFHQPGLIDESYVIFVGGRRKLCNFHLVTFIGQGPTEDKVKPTKKASFVDFGLSSIGPWTIEVQQFPVVIVLRNVWAWPLCMLITVMWVLSAAYCAN